VSDIFISYAIEDLDRIKLLVKALEEVGWSVWWDRSMLPGSRWQRVLRDAIGVAKCVMVAWSETSITSEWVEVEAEEGRRRGILVPVLIDDVVPPFPFGGIQAARLVGWSGRVGDAEFEKLVRAVDGVVPRPTVLGHDQRAAKVEEGWRQREEAEADLNAAEQRGRREGAEAAARAAEERRHRQEAEAAAKAAAERRQREEAGVASGAIEERRQGEADAAANSENEQARAIADGRTAAALHFQQGDFDGAMGILGGDGDPVAFGHPMHAAEALRPADVISDDIGTLVSHSARKAIRGS
jgi:hypothetical protein